MRVAMMGMTLATMSAGLSIALATEARQGRA